MTDRSIRKPSARVLIADDHRLVAETCKNTLEPEFEVVGIATDGRALVEAAFSLKPDIVLLDIGMPQLNGLDAGEKIKAKMPKVKLVFLTMNLGADIAAEAFRRGASAYVLKQSAAEELLTALRKVLRGESYLSPLITRETITQLLRRPNERSEKRITSRQSEILQLLAEGKSMKEAAAILNLKPGTIAFHKYRMMQNLGIRTNAELLEYAIRHQMTGSSQSSL
jgi:DNA-binding NarL/FixJ family response regulator